ncbi:hypothetical protein [Microvirga brassicacearum]|uniref:Transcriptional regulator n=1 Tax=Microvirga brassicacearum TaxID=2580413 RepID=A0A5N3PD52_9HYPH|nr:hypothetical protein [Microvirga brassicacearum]KAB0267640.1 hypothetical protein FEZ63_10170 [Microvirga brassicacearum]
MSRRDKAFPLKSFLQEEMTLALSDTMLNSIALLPSVTRLRLLAFLHFVDEPKSLAAELNFADSGDLRLTLIARQPAESGNKH